MYMPPNVTPLIQPMDQNAIRITKLFYRKNLLTDLLSEDKEFSETLKNYSLRDAVLNIAMAWNNVNTAVIKKCWNNILNIDDDDQENIPLSVLRSRLINDEAFKANQDIGHILQNITPNVSKKLLSKF